MKKLFVSVFIITAFVLYSIFHKQVSTAAGVPVVGPPISNTPSTSQSNSSPSLTPANFTNGALYKDGTYIGGAFDAYYGNVQVKATIQNGKIADVQFLQYPNSHRESIQINSQAMPILSQEAIQAQNAQVDTVSGATDTSEAFVRSLSDALSQAKT
jgi:uncharacterized protein with FMN-binding domain